MLRRAASKQRPRCSVRGPSAAPTAAAGHGATARRRRSRLPLVMAPLAPTIRQVNHIHIGLHTHLRKVNISYTYTLPHNTHTLATAHTHTHAQAVAP